MGHPAHLAAKAKGDNSMPGKRESPEDVYGAVPQGPRDMARAALPEPQFPAMQRSIPRSPRLLRGHPDTVKSDVVTGTFRRMGGGE